MRLIDAEKITEKEICFFLGKENSSCADDVMDMLTAQPTAYDVDAVVHQMEAVREKYRSQFLADHSMKERMLNSERERVMSIAIQIVKGGGVDGN